MADIGFSYEGTDLSKLAAASPGVFSQDLDPITKVFSGFGSGDFSMFAMADFSLAYQQRSFPRDKFISSQNADLSDYMCHIGYRPTLTFRYKVGGVYNGGAQTFYIWKPTENSLKVTNSSGSDIWIDSNTMIKMIFFQICGGGGQGGNGGGSWIFVNEGGGGGGGAIGVGWAYVPVTSNYLEGVKVSLGHGGYDGNQPGGQSSITPADRSLPIFYANGGGDANEDSSGGGGGFSGVSAQQSFTVVGGNGGSGSNNFTKYNSGCSATLAILKGYYDTGIYSTKFITISHPAINFSSGVEKRGIPGSSMALATTSPGTDGMGGAGGTGGDSNPYNGAAGAFQIYY